MQIWQFSNFCDQKQRKLYDRYRLGYGEHCVSFIYNEPFKSPGTSESFITLVILIPTTGRENLNSRLYLKCLCYETVVAHCRAISFHFSQWLHFHNTHRSTSQRHPSSRQN